MAPRRPVRAAPRSVILLDTNVLVYALNQDAPQHQDSRAVVDAALDGRVPAVMVPQVLVEAYAVLTDPRRVEKPLGAPEAWAELDALRRGLRVLDLGPQPLEVLGELIITRRPVGQDIFDVLLVAQMRAHAIGTLCTYNVEDFRGYGGISVERPRDTLDRFGLG